MKILILFYLALGLSACASQSAQTIQPYGQIGVGIEASHH